MSAGRHDRETSDTVPGNTDQVSGQAAPATRSIRRNVAWMMVARGIHLVTRWSVIAAMAKLGSTEMVGQYVLGIAISMPVFGLLELQLRAVQATDTRGEHPFNLFLALRLITTLIAIGIIVGIAFIFYPVSTAAVLILVGLYRATESIVDVFQGPMHQRERMDQMAMSVIVRGVLGSIATVVVLVATGSLIASVAAMIIVSLAVLWWFDAMKVAAMSCPQGTPLNMKPNWNRRELADLTWVTLPLGVTMMLSLLQYNIPRYMLENWHGTAALGIFAGIAYFVDASRQLVMAVGTSVSPRLAKHFAMGERRQFHALLFKFMGVCIVPALLALIASIVAGPFVLRCLLSQDYVAHVEIFRILMLAAVISSAACAAGYGMMATRKFRRSLIPFMVSSSWSVIISWLLIPTYGLGGAAWAFVAICVVTWIMPMLVILTVGWPPAQSASLPTAPSRNETMARNPMVKEA